jgi:hypothetical protein
MRVTIRDLRFAGLCDLLDHDIVHYRRWLPSLRRNLLPSPSRCHIPQDGNVPMTKHHVIIICRGWGVNVRALQTSALEMTGQFHAPVSLSQAKRRDNWRLTRPQIRPRYGDRDKPRVPLETEPFNTTFFFLFLWRYSPNLGLGLPPWNSPFHFSLLDLRQTVGLLGRVISSSQGLSTVTVTLNATFVTVPFPFLYTYLPAAVEQLTPLRFV